MTEFRALMLIFAGALLVTTAAILGLSAVHANGSAVVLGGMVPAFIASHLCSRVVVHYGRPRRHRAERSSRR